MTEVRKPVRVRGAGTVDRDRCYLRDVRALGNLEGYAVRHGSTVGREV